MNRGLVVLSLLIVATASYAAADTEPLHRQGRRLMSSWYTDPDTNYQSSSLAEVDETYKTRSYTTESQRAQVARYAQALAVAASGQNPDMNDTIAEQQVSSDNSQLMHAYEQHKVDAVGSATEISPSPSSTEASPSPTPSPTSSPATVLGVTSAWGAAARAAKANLDDSSSDSSNDSPAESRAQTQGVQEVKEWGKKTANEISEAVGNVTEMVKDKIKHVHSPTPTSSPVVAAVAAAHSQAYHKDVHTASVTSTDSIGGPIKLFNPYQSSDFDNKRNPASAAIDGDINTASQTAVDTDSCAKLNDEGQYGTCGLMNECVATPYYTGSYASTPNYPYWIAEFSSDISASYQVTHVVITNRQECCRCPLAGAKIYIGNPAAINLVATKNPDLSQDANWQLCATVPDYSDTSSALIFSKSSQYTQTFLCSQSLVGQAVAIQLPASTTILTLAEVSVVGINV